MPFAHRQNEAQSHPSCVILGKLCTSCLRSVKQDIGTPTSQACCEEEVLCKAPSTVTQQIARNGGSLLLPPLNTFHMHDTQKQR